MNKPEVIEIYKRDSDHPTHYKCTICGSEFPVIGDSDTWVHCPDPQHTPDYAPVYTEEVCDYVFNKYAEQATDRLVNQLTQIGLRRVIQRVARDRMRAGVDTFGDHGWIKHPDRLTVEILEELADAVVYSVMRENAQSGGPGSHYK